MKRHDLELMKKNQEILALKRKIENLQRELNIYKYDSLTGLPTRYDFEVNFDNFIHDYNTFGKPFVFALVDINDLHYINREYGYQAGDGVIVKVTTSLEENLMSANIYRIGGDEFVVLCRNRNEESINDKILSSDIAELVTVGTVTPTEQKCNRTDIFKEADDKIIEGKKNKRIIIEDD